jgi:hypothetical protein
MDPRFLAIEQDKVIAAAAAAAERQDATESHVRPAAALNVHFDAQRNKIFKIVFFPDRIYHAQYLNARAARYQYNVLEVRGDNDFIVLKEVYLMENSVQCAAHEYRADARRVVRARTLRRRRVVCGADTRRSRNRRAQALRQDTTTSMSMPTRSRSGDAGAAADSSHSFKVLDQMGLHKPITAVPGFRRALRDLRRLTGVHVSFRETDIDRPFNYRIKPDNVGWDNDYFRSHQEPNRPEPNSPNNTIDDRLYFANFQRAFVLDAEAIPPVLYQNAMMEPTSSDYFTGSPPEPGKLDGDKNVMGMRWIIQRELGGTIVYFHQVIVPPGAVEGTHQHIGSEELYYFIEGEGIAYVGDGDDPAVDAAYPLVDPTPDIYGLGPKPCRRLPVRPGTTIFTKSGGMHGVRNPKANPRPLKFVAFGYHTS